MGKMVLVTGGARSGKSKFAESMMKQIQTDILYIATAIPYDEEMKLRIKKHRESRPGYWETYEGFEGLENIILNKGKEKKGILLDCVTIFITNLLFKQIGEQDVEDVNYDKIEIMVSQEVKRIVESIKSIDATTVLVTNELGSGIVPENKLSRNFRDIAGRVNQYLASEADEVYLTVCGLPISIK